ncbi:MAG: phospholipid transport system substrate-binding protein [Gammaproteobacteria bacterium]
MNRKAYQRGRQLFRGFFVSSWLCALLISSPAFASTHEPDVIVRDLFHELLQELATHREDNSLSEDKVREIFASVLNPRIDYLSLARWILRDHWTTASVQQQEKFLHAFQAYIINTYSLALSSGEKIVMDVRANPVLRKNTAIVTADFAVEDADSIPIDFRMIERDDKWLLFDVSFEGVSLALTFRSDFNYVAKEGGIDSITEHLSRRSGRTP